MLLLKNSNFNINLIMKHFSLFMIFLFMMIMINSESMFIWWISIEMVSLLFIFFLMFPMNQETLENSMKYFVVQSISAIVFFFIMMMNSLINLELMNDFFFLLLCLCLMMKLGLFPFHKWFIDLMMNNNLMNMFMLMTMQKIPNLIIFYKCYYFLNEKTSMFFMVMLILGYMYISISSILSKNFIKMLSYSSINNMMILLMLILINLNLSIIIVFFMFYSMNIMFLLILLNSKILLMNNIKMTLSKYNMTMMMLLLMLMNFPPMVTFFIKIIMFMMMLNKLSFLMLIIFMIMMFFSNVFYLMMMFKHFWKISFFTFYKYMNLKTSKLDVGFFWTCLFNMILIILINLMYM